MSNHTEPQYHVTQSPDDLVAWVSERFREMDEQVRRQGGEHWWTARVDNTGLAASIVVNPREA